MKKEMIYVGAAVVFGAIAGAFGYWLGRSQRSQTQQNQTLLHRLSRSSQSHRHHRHLPGYQFPRPRRTRLRHLLVTEDEKQGKVSPQEFKNQEQAEAILRQVMDICTYKTLTNPDKVEQEELDDEELEAQREWNNPALSRSSISSSGSSSKAPQKPSTSSSEVSPAFRDSVMSGKSPTIFPLSSLMGLPDWS